MKKTRARSILNRIALRNSLRNWRYSLASMVTIAAGFTSLSLFQAYILELDRSYFVGITRRLMMGEVVVEKKEDAEENRMNKSEQLFVEDFEKKFGVEISMRYLEISGSIATSKRSGVLYGAAVDLEASHALRGSFAWNTLAGKPPRAPGSLLLGLGLAQTLGCEAPPESTYIDRTGHYIPLVRPMDCEDDSVQVSVNTVSGQANAMDFPVSGITNALTKEIDDRYALFSLEDAQRLLNTDVIHRYSLIPKGGSDRAAKFVKEFNVAATQAKQDLTAKEWTVTPMGDFYVRAIGLVRIYRNFIGAIFVLIAGLAIFNTTLKVVKERTREIGTLRSLGFTRAHLMRLFLTETMITALLGCTLGLLLTLVSSLGLNAAGIFYKAGILSEPVPFQLAISFVTYGVISAFLVLIALAASYTPVRDALSVKVVDNLNHV